MPLKKISELASLYWAAYKFGVPFHRRRSFVPPFRIYVNGMYHPLRFECDEGVKWDFLSVILEDSYGIAKLSSQISSIVDVGGNVGFFSLCARNYYPAAKIHTYEPNPALTQALEFQSQTFGFDYFNEAVGGHSTTISMDLERGEDSNLGRARENPAGTVLQRSLDEVVERIGGCVDLLKLDCEGAEWGMFREASCWHKVRFLTMEYHLFEGETHDQLRETIVRLGFKISRWRFAPSSHLGHMLCERLHQN